MKKIFTLAVAACSVLAVSAKQITKSDLQASKISLENKLNVEKKVVPFAPNFERSFKNGALPSVKERIAALKADVAADTAFYIADPYYVYYGGKFADGYSTYPSIMQPCDEEVTFYNLSTFAGEAQFGWTLDGENIMSVDTDLVVPAGFFEQPGMYIAQTPIFMMASGAQYYYGEGVDQEFGEVDWMAYPDFAMPMTKCHTYTSSDYSEDFSDSYPWAFNASMPYIFGTGLDLTAYRLGLVDTLGTSFGFEGYTTEIDSISIMVMSWDSPSVAIGNAFTLDICNVDVQNNQYLIDVDNPVASHTATAADITYEYAGKDFAMGIVTFPIKKTMNGEFWISLHGLNGTGANFGIWSDGADPFGAGDTYTIVNDEFRNIFGMNIDMSVNAIITKGATALRSANDAVKAQKSIENGQVVIRRGDRVFNALGQQIVK